ncbi:MAG: amidohydrolase family protein [bacterium]
MEKLLFKNGWFCQIVNNKIVPFYGAVEVAYGKIVRFIKNDESLLVDLLNERKFEIIDLNGKFVTTPFTNFHEHIYSKLAKGLKINSPLANFDQILSDYWWLVDCALDEEMVKYSALLTGIDSIKNGIGTIFDHHSSPNFTKNSLNTIAEALRNLNLKHVLCYEVTDRNGIAKSIESIDENINFIQNQHNEFSKGLFGMHASFTIDGKTLQTISSKFKNLNTGVHIHICEDKADRIESIKKYNKSPLERLLENDLINDKSILAHGVDLTINELEKIKKIGASIALNPDSNLNNSVGLIDFKSILNQNLLLGSDGMHSNMLKSLKNVFLISRYQGLNFGESFELITKIFNNQLLFLDKFFPSNSKLQLNDSADLVVWDYTPPTIVTEENVWGHIIYGLTESTATDFISSGKFILKEKKLKIMDENKVLNEAKEQGAKLYSKIASLGGK